MHLLRVVISVGLALQASVGLAKTQTQSAYLVNHQRAEVVQQSTGLVWQACAAGMTLKAGKCSGEALALTHSQATDYAKQLSVKTGLPWRLPTQEELASLVHCQHRALPGSEQRAIDGCIGHRKGYSAKPTVFSRLPDLLWSNTTYVDGEYTNRAMLLDFKDAQNKIAWKETTELPFLLVRGETAVQERPYSVQYGDLDNHRYTYYGACRDNKRSFELSFNVNPAHLNTCVRFDDNTHSTCIKEGRSFDDAIMIVCNMKPDPDKSHNATNATE